MSGFRIQDVVGKLSGVNLQSTVSVLNALYVVSKEFEREGNPEFTAFRDTLEQLLLVSALNDEGTVQGLRAVPSRINSRACIRFYRRAAKYLADEVGQIKWDSPEELIVPIAKSAVESYDAWKAA